MISHDEMRDNVAVYALGALPPAEARAVAEHLRDCDECAQEYRLLRPAVSALATAQAEGGGEPSPLLKARVMREVRRSGAPRRIPRVWPAWLAAAACLALALLAAFTNLSLKARLARENVRLARENALIADFSAGNARHYRFGSGQVLVRDGRLYIAMHALPPPPRGKVYQAWALPKGSKRMAPEQTFVPAQTGPTILQIPVAAEKVAAVAVSVEPAGGSKQPTSAPIAVATL